MPYELLLTEPRSIAVRPYDEEPVAPNEVRAEAIVSGISHGTELALYRGVSPFDGKRFDPDLRLFVEDAESAAYPMRLGYEWVGTVTETGAEVRAQRVGDLVHLALPHRETHTFAVDDDRKPLTPLPAGLDPERGALLSSATIALQAIHDARVKVGDTVAVFGLGAFGLLAVQLARLSGAGWIAGVDPIAGRRELALPARGRRRPRSVGRRRRTRDQARCRARRRRRGDRVLGTLLRSARRAAQRASRGHGRGGRVLHRRRRRRAAARRGVAPQPADARQQHERLGRAAPRCRLGSPASARDCRSSCSSAAGSRSTRS